LPEKATKKPILEHAKACVGPGWHGLLDGLVPKLLALGWDGHVAQVKEKFGGLRFYVGAATDEVHDAINEAEAKSFETCEQCGAPGKPRDGGWIKTLCDSCAVAK
jgi:hypothetical protein